MVKTKKISRVGSNKSGSRLERGSSVRRERRHGGDSSGSGENVVLKT